MWRGTTTRTKRGTRANKTGRADSPKRPPASRGARASGGENPGERKRQDVGRGGSPTRSPSAKGSVLRDVGMAVRLFPWLRVDATRGVAPCIASLDLVADAAVAAAATTSTTSTTQQLSLHFEIKLNPGT